MMDATGMIERFSSIGKIAMSLLNAKDDAERARIFTDFQRELASSHADNLAICRENIELAKKLNATEAECLKLKEWGADKARYRLVNFGAGGMVYALKESHRDTDPPHWICANCYARGSKSFLHVEDNGGWPKIQCSVCSTGIPAGSRGKPTPAYATD